ncbi:calcium-binding protein [Tistrella mobilis]|uniref:calcium-binding protein n=1 Tax=Tistrella mobilis TaxID=171437 RepID=UPI0031F6529B
MATVTAYQPIDMDDAYFGYGTVVRATASMIQVRSGSLTQTYTGSFSYDTRLGTIKSGTMTGTVQQINGAKVFEVTGARHDAVKVVGYMNRGDAAGLYAYVLNGNDRMNGSSGGDVIKSYGGDDQLYGNGGNDRLEGGSGNDRLEGGSGNDRLDGGSGNDTLLGGAGNDVYVVDSTGDRVFETLSTGSGTDAGGIDEVQSRVSWTLGSFVEKLTLTGTAAINATGNGLANTLKGNAAANTLDGKGGADVMLGMGGNDIYIVDNVRDRVYETTSTTSGTNAGGTDEVRASVSWTLGSFVEKLTLTGTAAINGTGNGLGNTLTGNGAANTLDGGAGNDFLYGLGGNDVLKGGTGNDLLAGGAGMDRLTGGSGRDIFRFDTAPGSDNRDIITDYVVADDTIQLENAIFTRLTKTGVLAAANFRMGNINLQ